MSRWASHGHSHVHHWLRASSNAIPGQWPLPQCTSELQQMQSDSQPTTRTLHGIHYTSTNHPLTKPMSCASTPQHAQCVTTIHLQMPPRLVTRLTVASRVCSCRALPAAALPAATLCWPSSSCSMLRAASSFSPTCTRSHLQALNTC